MTPISVSTVGSQATITITVPLVFPKIPGLPISFPPQIPSVKLPGLSPALAAIAQALLYIQRVIDKLVKLIPGVSIRLIIKVGPATIFDQVISTPTYAP